MSEDEKTQYLPSEISSEILSRIIEIIASYPNRAHFFSWSKANYLLFIPARNETERPSLDWGSLENKMGKKNAAIQSEEFLALKKTREIARLKAKQLNGLRWNLGYLEEVPKPHGAGMRSKDGQWEQGPWSYYFDKEDIVFKKNQIASNRYTKQKYYYKKICAVCGRTFFSKREDANYCRMKTCQKRKSKNEVNMDDCVFEIDSRNTMSLPPGKLISHYAEFDVVIENDILHTCPNK
jgi:hypothetical protein